MRRAILSGKGRRWLLGGHPWVYADDVQAVDGEPGDLLPVFDPNQKPLGWALFSTHSRISLRMVTRAEEQPGRAFWLSRVQRAIEARSHLGYMDPEGACRLIAGDADGIPGLVVDRYKDVAVIQSGCQGSDRIRDFILELIDEVSPIPIRAVLDRSDSGVRKLEDLQPRVEWVRGGPKEVLEVVEDGLVFEVDVLQGHKTGHYLDQRENRIRGAQLVREGDHVLDAFSYDGLFGIRAAMAGAADVLCLDQNAGALERLRRNAERNGVADRVRVDRGNAMQSLRNRVEEDDRYDLVVCDPPAFARNRREADGARRGYVELNQRAMTLCKPGGHLISASCSYNVRAADFAEHLGSAALQAGVDAFLVEARGAAPDHTVHLNLPESSYLKCSFLRVHPR